MSESDPKQTRVRQPSRNFDDVADDALLRPLNREAAPIQRGLSSMSQSF
jgi:hypothetical protein